jgi:hypothetical protein
VEKGGDLNQRPSLPRDGERRKEKRGKRKEFSLLLSLFSFSLS